MPSCLSTNVVCTHQYVKHIDGADLQNDNTVIECKQLDLTEVSDDLLWQGGDSFIGDSFSIEGKYCSSFQPDVTILDGKAYQKFNNSLMFDFGAQLQFSSDSPSVTQVAHAKQSDSDPQKACYCCRKNVKLMNMRTHVGKHILAKDIESRFPCGYCGKDACSRSTIHTDKKKRYPKPQSNCPNTHS